jgi:hypothetical protein
MSHISCKALHKTSKLERNNECHLAVILVRGQVIVYFSPRSSIDFAEEQ